MRAGRIEDLVGTNGNKKRGTGLGQDASAIRSCFTPAPQSATEDRRRR